MQRDKGEKFCNHVVINKKWKYRKISHLTTHAYDIVKNKLEEKMKNAYILLSEKPWTLYKIVERNLKKT